MTTPRPESIVAERDPGYLRRVADIVGDAHGAAGLRELADRIEREGEVVVERPPLAFRRPAPA